jgi:hypothetical protein
MNMTSNDGRSNLITKETFVDFFVFAPNDKRIFLKI